MSQVRTDRLFASGLMAFVVFLALCALVFCFVFSVRAIQHTKNDFRWMKSFSSPLSMLPCLIISLLSPALFSILHLIHLLKLRWIPLYLLLAFLISVLPASLLVGGFAFLTVCSIPWVIIAHTGSYGVLLPGVYMSPMIPAFPSSVRHCALIRRCAKMRRRSARNRMKDDLRSWIYAHI